MFKRIREVYSLKRFWKRTSAQDVYEKQLAEAEIDLAKWQHHADFAVGNVYLLEDRVTRLKEVVKK